MTNRTATVLADGFGFVEAPRWHDGLLWLSDFRDRTVVTIDGDGTRSVIATVDGRPSGMGWLPDGRLLVVSMDHRRLMRLDPAGLVVHAELSGIATWHCNDMVVDQRGRAYVGNCGFDFDTMEAERGADAIIADPNLPAAAIALVDPDGSVSVAATGLRFPNGSVITQDRNTLVVAESFGERLAAFDIDAMGKLSNRRIWAALPGVVPDGICLDAEGAVWVANPLARECLRVAEGGAILDRVETSAPCYACMLGGDDRTTLFLMTNTDDGPRHGRVETVDVDVPGVGWP